MTESKQEPIPAPDVTEQVQPEPLRHPLVGIWKGLVTIAPGVDLTQPADPELGDWIEEKYGKGNFCDE